MFDPSAGRLLIANPHLNDPNFLRSVVFLCEHDTNGTLGFVLNRKTAYTVEELAPELVNIKLPVYEGGPVGLNTLHFLHQFPDAIADSKKVTDNIYWGGDFDQMAALLNSGTLDTEKIKFFLGYSGWDSGQLAYEMEEKTWIVALAQKKFVFHNHPDQLWKDVLKDMGGEYALILNAPINPQLN